MDEKSEKIIWHDITSFSKGDKERKIRTVECEIGNLRLCVTKHIYLEDNKWGIICRPFFDLHKLKSSDLEEAKKEALVLLEKELINCLVDLDWFDLDCVSSVG